MGKHAIGPEAPALPRCFYWLWAVGVVPTAIYIGWGITGNHTYEVAPGETGFWFNWAIIWVVIDVVGMILWFRANRREDYEILKPWVQWMLTTWAAYRAFERHEDKRIERAVGHALDQRAPVDPYLNDPYGYGDPYGNGGYDPFFDPYSRF